MVIPSRWMAGGRGLGEFRAEFLGDRHVRTLVDYENAKDVFPDCRDWRRNLLLPLGSRQSGAVRVRL